jgi:putative redox protein
MVEIKIKYEGDLHCSASHTPSGTVISTDAPVDNQGRGESFSPTDLVATALGSCMATVMGIVARRKEVDLVGLHITVNKEMSTATPRRISRLTVLIAMPIAEDHPAAELLKVAVNSCPVHHSIHPDIIVDVTWHWATA